MIDNLEPKPDMWETNPRLKMLSLVFIFVFLFSGIALVVLSQVQNNYRQKIYQETISSLPKHEVRVLENQKVGESDIANWKTYKNDQFGFEFNYPNDWEVSRDGNTFTVSSKTDAETEKPGFFIGISSKTLKQVRSEIENRIDDFLKADVETSTILFDGVEAEVIDHGTAIGGAIRNILFVKNAQTFWIQYPYDLYPDKQIISTFKFSK